MLNDEEWSDEEILFAIFSELLSQASPGIKAGVAYDVLMEAYATEGLSVECLPDILNKIRLTSMGDLNVKH